MENKHFAIQFQAGGTLPKDFPAYVERDADEKLYQHILAGEFCYVLSARQMGKSSLRVRVMDRLEQRDYVCASIDLTSIGSHNPSAESWYYTFLHQLSKQMGMNAQLKDWWEAHANISPVTRVGEFFEQIVLKAICQNIVIFIDEIDTILSLDKEKFSTDDFFASIRGFFNARTDNPDYSRLNFVILGVATPNDLVNDPDRTPFNIGVPIPLNNFTYTDALPLLEGLKHIRVNHQNLLKTILYWTGGQPLLTQKLCRSIAEEEQQIIFVDAVVKTHVDNLFLAEGMEKADDNLSNVNHRLVNNRHYNAKMLALYEKLLSEIPVAVKDSYTAQLHLRLSGIVREQGGKLIIANRIYKHKFNRKWLKGVLKEINRPFSGDLTRWIELGRPREAALKGEVLRQAKDWAASRNDISDLEREFLDFSQIVQDEEHENQLYNKHRQKRKFMYWFFVMIILALLFGLSAFFLYLQSQHNQTVREAFRMALIAQQIKNQDPTKALMLSKQAFELKADPQIERAIYKLYSQNFFYSCWQESEYDFTALAISPDSRHVVVATANRQIFLYDATGKLVQEYKDNKAVVTVLCFAADGRSFLVGTQDGQVLRRTIDDAGSSQLLFRHKQKITALDIAPDNMTALSASADSSLRLWQVGQPQLTQTVYENSRILDACFTPDGRYILTAIEDGHVNIHDRAGKILKTLDAGTTTINAIAVSPDSRYVALACYNNNLQLLSLQGDEKQQWTAHQSAVSDVAFLPEGELIASSSTDGSIRFWNFDGQLLHSFYEAQAAVNELIFMPDSRGMLSYGRDRQLRHHHLTGLKLYSTHLNKEVNCGLLVPGSHEIYFGTQKGEIYQAYLDKRPPKLLSTEQQAIRDIALSNDQQYLIAVLGGYKSMIWQLPDNLIARKKHDNMLRCAAIYATRSDSSGFILLGSENHRVQAYSLNTDLHLYTLDDHTGPINDIYCSADGHWHLTASDDKTATLWDNMGDKIKSFEGHSQAVRAVCANKAMSEILTASDDSTARLWQADGKCLQVFKEQQGKVLSVAMSADGRLILTGGTDNQAILYDRHGSILRQFPQSAAVINVGFSSEDRYLHVILADGTAHIYLNNTIYIEDILKDSKLSPLTPEEKRLYLQSSESDQWFEWLKWF